MKKYLHGRAFTLVELLTAIAIIGILAAIMIPTVDKVRGVARRVVCTSNLRQIGTAFEINAVENNNRYPPPLAPDADGSGAWHDVLCSQLYGKTFAQFAAGQGTIFKCPVANVGETSASYGMNCTLAAFSANGSKADPWSHMKEPVLRQRIPVPAKTCLLIESKSTKAGYGTTFETETRPVTYRHSSMLNILYCDGHVETMLVEKIPVTASTPEGNLFWFSGI
ncbi:prepilin-type N-terminal cleavage/methylation domain-containing protein [Opitutaceae bacterium TAV1]|nr:prepilin-type N-terminal cleavage/methylation domain-containing protein [Opitutaceae bacterium TAV1]